MTPPREMPMLTTFLSIVVQSIILSCLVSRLVISPLMAANHTQTSLRTRLSRIPLATFWLWLSFLGSWCFVVAVDVLQHGSVLKDAGPCTASIFVCISLYCVSKASIYLFLTERAHIVRGGTRREDKLYWVNMSLILGIVVLWILCHVFRVVVRTPERCVISIGRDVDIPFIIYDFFINIFLTVQFLVPLLQSSSLRTRVIRIVDRFRGKQSSTAAAAAESSFAGHHTPEAERQLYTLARRTFIGGLFCTLVTIANGIQVAIMFGKEDAWLCLTTCSGDVVLNCLILHFITNGRQGTDESVRRASKVDLEARASRPKLELRTSSMVMRQAMTDDAQDEPKFKVSVTAHSSTTEVEDIFEV